MFLVLLLLYFVFSGDFSVKGIVIGVLVCALLTLFCRRFVSPGAGKPSPRKLWKKLLYFLFLLKEICASNIAVIKKIYSEDPVRAQLIRFHSGLETEGGNVLAANSITLTPGTFTCELEGDAFVVHALDQDFADGIEHCSFIEKLKELEALG